ncbi:universal stress protein [Luteolibacter sp. LG18]|uniref:universal stress protein n=1 Tax=Luteolibacter sp. LG18 TaxID=2819286 RepID=UPI002B3246E5|nr:universal stress protein [Luteolibacter sp. LG18]
MKTIVAALDFSDSTAAVLESAVEHARAFKGTLHLLHVLEAEPAYTAYGFTPDEFPAIHSFQEEARKRAVAKLDELLATVPSDVEARTKLADGSPLHAILEYVAEHSAELVILGTHGHGVVASLLLGSVAEGLIRKAAVPTLVIPVKRS